MRKHTYILLLLVLTAASPAQKSIKTDLVYLVKEATLKSDASPVLIMLHGYGSNEADLFDMAANFDGHYTVFSLRAPNEVRGGGYCWYPMEFLPDQQFKYNYEFVKKSRTAVLAFISQACKTYGLDSNKVVLMGYSQGAILSYDLAFAAPRRIKGVMALSGRLLSETVAAKTDWKLVAAQKYFIAHGSSDNVIKVQEADKAADFLKAKQVPAVQYNRYEMPHAITGQELNDMTAWLSAFLKPAKPADLKKH